MINKKELRMTDEHPLSIKLKMLEDAGFPMEELHKKYVTLVDFLKAIVNRKIYSLGVAIENAQHAEKVLIHIGELKDD
jgi:hypothetical protein